jgi:LysR family transcriptional regulator of gallate degradation
MQSARGDIAALADKGRVGNAPIFGMLTHERRVRAFVALAEQHHMPSVAESLGITQPAVSIAIRQIEDSIGIALFRRTARGTVPTPAGAALALRLKRALAGSVTQSARSRSLRGIAQGIVTVGALRPPDYASDLHGEPLATDELRIVCRSGHPRARVDLQAADLAQARWVLPRVNTPNRMLFERALSARGLPMPNVMVETSDLAVLRGVLMGSDLLTAVSPRQIAYELDAGLLAVLPFPLADTRRVIGITQRTDGLASPGAKILMDEIRRRAPSVLAALD